MPCTACVAFCTIAVPVDVHTWPFGRIQPRVGSHTAPGGGSTIAPPWLFVPDWVPPFTVPPPLFWRACCAGVKP